MLRGILFALLGDGHKIFTGFFFCFFPSFTLFLFSGLAFLSHLSLIQLFSKDGFLLSVECLNLGFVFSLYFKLHSFNLFFLKLFRFVEVSRINIWTRAARELGVKCVTLRNKLNNLFCISEKDGFIYLLASCVRAFVAFDCFGLTFCQYFGRKDHWLLDVLFGVLLSHLCFLFYGLYKLQAMDTCGIDSGLNQIRWVFKGCLLLVLP
ncbi:hypothetical protein EGJ18_07580 [Stutzerimonas stutzeri]|nr:hypothetical protein EGJ18_07580 [Stutzerimonas stutzeri]